MKRLQEIIDLLIEKDNLIDYSFGFRNVNVSAISYDSREVEEGTLFFCKGLKFKDKYLENAKQKGASAYISERKIDEDMPYIIVKDVRIAMMDIAKFFYDYPDNKIKTIGVTGTKGKSSTVKYIKSILDLHLKKQNKRPAGLITTIDIYDGIDNMESHLSTPEALMLYKYVYNAVNSGLEYMVIESSSQAFKYFRMNNLNLDIAVFLNIGEDHVSELEHPSFEDYFESKLKIFNQANFAIFNKDADHIEEIEEEIKKSHLDSKSFSINNDADVKLIGYNFESEELNFNIFYKDEEISLRLHQIGTYNIENAMAAFLVAKHFDIDNDTIREGLLHAQILGREEIFESHDKKYIMFVSYAHNELSFDKTFEFIKSKYPGYKIVTIYGISGKMAVNRMEGTAKSAGYNSDYIYVVPEDPDDTPYELIYEAMSEELNKHTTKYKKINTREDGIKTAFDNAYEKTVFFIAGKGVEDFQKVKGQYVKIKSDVDVAKLLIDEYNHRLK